jgi:hypothetical protein
MPGNKPLIIKVRNDELQISIGINTLEYVFEHSDYGASLQVSNPLEFAKDVARALEDEEEDGTTLCHRLLDKACKEACEQGSEWIVDANEDSK